jgi:O-antigen ligase
MVFPFLPFILAIATIKNEKHIRMVIYSLILGYTIPVLGSTFLIVTGKSEMVMGSSLYERQAGLSSGVHTLGHAMLFFSFVYAFYILITNRKDNSIEFMVVTTLFLLALFCMFKSYTRTVFLGGLVFWSIFLWRKNKIILFLLYVIGLLIFLFYISYIQNLIWQTKGLSNVSHDINTASSGRVWIWEHNIKLLLEQPITRIMLGVGLGHELDRIPESFDKWAGSHNDFLSVTIMLGIIGLVLYVLIYGAAIKALLKGRINYELKYLYYGIFTSVLIMNFISNSYIVRFQMAQLFWLFIGILYAIQGKKLHMSTVNA